MGELNSAMTELMDSIREKSGVTGKLSISAAKQAVDSITTGGDSADLPYRRYTGQITATVVGSGKYAVLAKNNDLAEHRNDETLFVRAEFDVEPAAYTLVKTWGSNALTLIPADTTNNRQFVLRYDGSAANSEQKSAYALNDNTTISSGTGRMFITEDGELRYYSNSGSNYAIRPCNYTVEVMW